MVERRGGCCHPRGDASVDHAHSAALTLEAAQQQQKPRRHRTATPAPSEKDGIKAAVLSPTHARPRNPIRLHDLIQPEKGKELQFLCSASRSTDRQRILTWCRRHLLNERRARKGGGGGQVVISMLSCFAKFSLLAHRRQVFRVPSANAHGMDDLSTALLVCVSKIQRQRLADGGLEWDVAKQSAGHHKLLEVAMDGDAGAMAQLGASLYDRGDKIQAASWLHKSGDGSHSVKAADGEIWPHPYRYVPAARSPRCFHLAEFDDHDIAILTAISATQRMLRRVSSCGCQD